MAKHYPSPEERADMVVRKLERTIRESRKDYGTSDKKLSGMSFRKWQDTARFEIADAVRNAVLDEVKSTRVSQTLLMIVGSCMATLGFLGVAVAWGRVDRVVAGSACVLIGFILLIIGVTWFARGSIGDIISDRRAAKMARINNLDKQVQKMETYLEQRKDFLKEKIERM